MNTLGIVAGQRCRGQAEQFCRAILWESAGQNHRIQIKDRRRRQDGKGKAVRSMAGPFGEDSQGRFILLAIIEGMRIIPPGRAGQRFKPGQRGALDQLCRHAVRGKSRRQGTDGRRRAARAGLQLVRQHQPAPDKAANIEIQKILDALAAPETQLGKAGRRHIMKKIGLRAHPGFHFGDDIDIVPSVERASRQVQLLFPPGQASRHGNAGPQNAGLLFGRQIGDQPGKVLVNQPQGRVRLRHREPFGTTRQHRAVKPHGDQVKRAAPDLDADRHRAKRVQRERG